MASDQCLVKPKLDRGGSVRHPANRDEAEDAMKKIVLYVSLFALLLVTAVAFVEFEYGSPVSRRGLSDLQVRTNSSRNPTTVSIDGGLISSALAARSVKQHRKGGCIVVVVREVPVREGRVSGTFHVDVAVSGDIDEIAFGDPHEVIWHR